MKSWLLNRPGAVQSGIFSARSYLRAAPGSMDVACFGGLQRVSRQVSQLGKVVAIGEGVIAHAVEQRRETSTGSSAARGSISEGLLTSIQIAPSSNLRTVSVRHRKQRDVASL